MKCQEAVFTGKKNKERVEEQGQLRAPYQGWPSVPAFCCVVGGGG